MKLYVTIEMEADLIPELEKEWDQFPKEKQEESLEALKQDIKEVLLFEFDGKEENFKKLEVEIK